MHKTNNAFYICFLYSAFLLQFKHSVMNQPNICQCWSLLNSLLLLANAHRSCSVNAYFKPSHIITSVSFQLCGESAITHFTIVVCRCGWIMARTIAVLFANKNGLSRELESEHIGWDYACTAHEITKTRSIIHGWYTTGHEKTLTWGAHWIHMLLSGLRPLCPFDYLVLWLSLL